MARRKVAGPSTGTVVAGIAGRKRGQGKTRMTPQQRTSSTRFHTPGKTRVSRTTRVLS